MKLKEKWKDCDGKELLNYLRKWVIYNVLFLVESPSDWAIVINPVAFFTDDREYRLNIKNNSVLIDDDVFPVVLKPLQYLDKEKLLSVVKSELPELYDKVKDLDQIEIVRRIGYHIIDLALSNIETKGE